MLICLLKKKQIILKKGNDMFEKIKKWYESGMWTKKMVHNAVVKGKITEEEYTEITGEAYE